jgi:hypothetical protein
VKNEAALEKALELQSMAYQLLRWLRERVDRSTVSFDSAHDRLSMPEAAHDWLKSNYSVIPVRCRPDRADLKAFANLVASFLATSFDLVQAPGTRKITGCGCWCSWCSSMVSASHLRTKKLTRQDKKRAHALQAEALLQRALDRGWSLSPDDAEGIAGRLPEEAAILAYADQLLRRMKGDFEGPAVLALWRRFAWSKTGAPKKNFRLKLEAIRRAESRIDEALSQPT